MRKERHKPVGGCFSNPEERPDLYEVCVGVGLKRFPMNRWREAILFYLDERWKGNHPGKISFGTIDLVYDSDQDAYYAAGNSWDKDSLTRYASLAIEVCTVKS